MKTDLYTKIVLTIIALALTINLFKESITPAMAAGAKPTVMVPLNADGTIDVNVVKMPRDVIDVNIQEIAGSNAAYNPILVKPVSQ
ncbi:hypothetical protein [Pedobacter antarcticus]|uniref:hypothetical protein n=1 Tax=Pedobacter antarcticus TaxID=34086 RepID=UPI0029319D4D|nr:hypothetical protein [Pedobacter antarcticus]